MTTIQPLGAGNPPPPAAAESTTAGTSTGSREAPASEPAASEAVQLEAAGPAYDRHGSGSLSRLAGGTISILA